MEPFSATHKDAKEHKAAEAAARKAHTERAGTFLAWLSDHRDPDAARALRREVRRRFCSSSCGSADATTTAASHPPGPGPGQLRLCRSDPCRNEWRRRHSPDAAKNGSALLAEIVP